MNTHGPVTSAKAWLIALTLALLSACGGGHPGGAQDKAEVIAASNSSDAAAGASTAPGFLPTSSEPPSEQTIALQKEGARLNSEELAQIAKTGVLPQAFEGPLLSGAEKAASSGSAKIAATSPRTAVYRFYNTKTSAHFFTTSTAERDNVQATLPFMSFEGPAFYAAGTAVPGLSPVHRFYNTQTGVHFYTISESERALVAASLPQFTYEGIAYYASTLPGTGYTPLYRFFYSAKGFHFYTNSQSERDNIIATLPQYSYEGVGYYVLDTDWKVPAIPHSGVTSSQCYQAGSDTLVSCASAGALALNPQQDGHRAAINPMSYGGVPGHKPLDSCVLDQVTGLIWEVKTASGLRSGANTYTNLGNGAATDSSGYVAAINAMQLCGATDWRMPTRQELLALVDYGSINGPMLNTVAFPNSASAEHWTANADSTDSEAAWWVIFSSSGGWTDVSSRSASLAVRLVRGSAQVGTRYTFSTIAYTGDAANNVVNDGWTGLQWRRCEEGRVWSGSACNGSVSKLMHDQALAHARDQSGWRLPSVKELASLTDLSVVSGGAFIDPTAFPTGGLLFWSSSPYVGNAKNSWVVDFTDGNVSNSLGGYSLAVRLVRASQ